jgi:hypothetical protein
MTYLPVITDEELTVLALSTDLTPLSPDATAWSPTSGPSPLPGWYMPMPTSRLRPHWSRYVIAAIIVGFLLIDACGLCITSGFLTLA